MCFLVVYLIVVFYGFIRGPKLYMLFSFSTCFDLFYFLYVCSGAPPTEDGARAPIALNLLSHTGKDAVNGCSRFGLFVSRVYCM